ncbi:MAG TPA: phosphatidylserine/phosphatidylglycerophosphate/cardiolipin synthase family protein [Kofleriaceae bacterium]|nr:phosphatidylserine/phosphatidylglycerophosphate/cardiolipin synthase family protein [Kofleriaceae bacterium]
MPLASRSFLLSLLVALCLADGAGPAQAETRPGRRPGIARAGRSRPVRIRPARRAPRRASLRLAAATGRLLATPAASASARLDLIRSARGEINTSAYIFSDDRVGRIALAELRAAARAGRRVRLLLDGAGNRLSRAALAHLLEEGVEVGIYNRLRPGKLLHPVKLTYRLHDKLLVVDGEHLVLGGRNVEEGYFGFSRPGYTHFDDVDAYAGGEAAADANRYFMELWSGPQVERLRRADLAVSARKVARYRDVLDHAARVSGRPGFEAFRARWRAEPTARLARVEFIHEDPRTLKNQVARTQRRLLRVIDEAASEVEIHTPYLVPDRELLGAVARARERGVTVRFVTNSLANARGHELLAQWAYESQLRALAAAGAEVWEVKGPRVMHAKTVVADRRHVYIGSFNMDQRSRRLQKETGILADSPDLAARTLGHGENLRAGGLLAARGGAVTALKRKQCGRACRFFARFVYGPFTRVTGLYGQL